MFFQRCFVVFFHDERADPCARDLIKMLKQTDVKKKFLLKIIAFFFFSQIVLVQSKSYAVDENSAERLFSGSKNYTSQVNKGPALGLEFAGMNAVQLCQQSLHNLITSKYSNLSRQFRIFSNSSRFLSFCCF